MAEQTLKVLAMDLLRDLVTYRTHTSIHKDTKPDHIKRFIREMSDRVMENTDIDTLVTSENPLEDKTALHSLIQEVYKYSNNKQTYIFRTVCLFTYIAEMCVNLPEERHPVIVHNVTGVLMSLPQGWNAISVFQEMYEWERTKVVAMRVIICSLCIATVLVWMMR